MIRSGGPQLGERRAGMQAGGWHADPARL